MVFNHWFANRYQSANILLGTPNLCRRLRVFKNETNVYVPFSQQPEYENILPSSEHQINCKPTSESRSVKNFPYRLSFVGINICLKQCFQPFLLKFPNISRTIPVTCSPTEREREGSVVIWSNCRKYCYCLKDDLRGLLTATPIF